MRSRLGGGWCAFIGVLAALALLSHPHEVHAAQGWGNTQVGAYMRANWDAKIARGVPYPARAPLLVLHGTWRQMGVQYGRRSARYIRIVYDAVYSNFLQSHLPPQKLSGVLDRYVHATRQLSPAMVRFIRGMAIGAGPVLRHAQYARALDDFHKIFLINSVLEVGIPYDWPNVARLMGVKLPAGSARTARAAGAFSLRDLTGSHSWAAWGSATTSGTTIAGGTRDQPWWPLFYTVAYVAIPSDPAAHIVYGNSIAGAVAASTQVNARGVYVGNTIGGPPKGVGVPVLIATAYVSFYADSARQAARFFTLGPRAYRRRTHRRTLAYGTGFDQMVADPHTALVVERESDRYAVRRAGQHGERGPFLVLTNHDLSNYSYDARARRTPVSLAKLVSPSPSSASRYLGLFWEITNRLGKVGVPLAIDDLARLDHTYTADGEKVTEKDGLPVWRFGLTPEDYIFRDPTDLGTPPIGGNLVYVVADLASRNVWFIQGITRDWAGPWQHVWLGDPAYRLVKHRR